MELWDLFDLHRRPLGRTHERGKPLSEGEYHVSVHVAVFNSAGELLIQRRVPTKQHWPKMWEMSAAGSVTAGEDSPTGAERELFEELGIRVSFENIRPSFTFNYSRGFGDVYILNEDVDLKGLTLQPEEVTDARYASLDEVLSMIDSGEFLPYHESFIRFLFDRRHETEAYKG